MTTPARVRLATFNLENLGFRDGEATAESRERLPRHMDALRAVIERLDADGVAFQEVLDPNLLDPLLAGFGYKHRALADRGSSPLRLGVFSRFPLSDARPVATGIDLTSFDAKTAQEIVMRGAFSRPALQVRWEIPGLPVTLVVVHWKSKIPSFTPRRREGRCDPWESLGDAGEGRLVTELKRLAQAVQVRRAVDQLLETDPGGHVAVLGDFNDGMGSEGVRIVAGDARACICPTLVANELVPCELSVPADLRFSQIYRGQKQMLDHILVTRSLLPRLEEARILNETLRAADDNPGPDPYDAGSDHAPFVVSFRV